MAYTIDRVFWNPVINEIVERTVKALSAEGFGILTEIDVKALPKSKFAIETSDYLILGACNPKMAHKAMTTEPRVGAMPPSNVIVRDIDNQSVEVNAIDSLAAIDNVERKSVASDVRSLMENAVNNIHPSYIPVHPHLLLVI